MLRHASLLMLSLALVSSARAQSTEETLEVLPQAPPTAPAPVPPGYLPMPDAPHHPHHEGGWPKLFVLSADALFATTNYRDAVFVDRQNLMQIPGETLHLRRFSAPGAEVSMRLAPTRLLEIGLSIGALFPRIGDLGTAITPRREMVTVTEAHIAFWHGEFNLVARTGAVAFSFGVHVGWARMVLDLEGDGPSVLRSARATAGPQVDLRARLYRSLFVHVGALVDLLQWPDAQLQVGLGLAGR